MGIFDPTATKVDVDFYRGISEELAPTMCSGDKSATITWRRRAPMKAFLAAVVVALVLAVGSAYVLDSNWQSSTSTAFTSEGVRLDDPGRNLIGTDGVVGRRG
jgi:hypothetical protein